MSSEFDAGREWRTKFQEQEMVNRYLFEKALAEAARKSRKAAMRLWSGPLVAIFLAGLIWYWKGTEWALWGSGVAIVWAIVGAWNGWRLKPQQKGVEQSGVAYLRGELVWQRSTLDQALLWSLGPMALGIVLLLVVLAGKEEVAVRKMMPFCFLCLAWLIGFVGLRWKERRELAKALEALGGGDGV